MRVVAVQQEPNLVVPFPGPMLAVGFESVASFQPLKSMRSLRQPCHLLLRFHQLLHESPCPPPCHYSPTLMPLACNVAKIRASHEIYSSV